MSLKLTEIKLENFRNLNFDIDISLSPTINCIFGNNGNGKTNLLEAIYWVCHRKSFKSNTKFAQLLSYDHMRPGIRFYSSFKDDHQSLKYNGEWLNDKKNYYYDGIKTKKKPNVDALFINPFDSFLFHQQKTFRKTWIDNHLSMIDLLYKDHLKKYNQAQRQRKKIITSNFQNPIVDQFEKIMVDSSIYITQKREHFLGLINPILSKSFHEFFSIEHNLKIELESVWKTYNKDDRLNDLKTRRQKDSIIGQTSAGIHKDDFIFYFDGMNSYEYCSLGQQKMSYLSLIFSFINFYIDSLNRLPIVLIDDVSGELDNTRWKNLVNFLIKREFQVFITTANENFKHDLMNQENIKEFFVEDGLVSSV